MSLVLWLSFCLDNQLAVFRYGHNNITYTCTCCAGICDNFRQATFKMITGNTDAIKVYDIWFGNNYKQLQKHCKRYRIPDDYLNDVYLNVRDRIVRSGFTEQYYQTYVKRSLHNLMINEAKKCNGRFEIDFDDEDYTVTIENTLQDNDETEKDTQQYREDIMFLSKKIFEYIMNEKRYNDEWQFVFRSYYLCTGRMTYAKLTAMTGINKNQCTKIIQNIKKDIRTNFLNWLKEDDKRRKKSD